MSGFGIATNGWRPQKIRFGARPPVGGAMCASGAFTWSAPNMGATQQADVGVFGAALDAIVSVEIDNRKNGYAVVVEFPDTDQTIVCPPFGRVCQPAATSQLKLSASLIVDPSIVAAQLTSGLTATTKIRLFNIYMPETYEHPEYNIANDILVPKRNAVTSIAGVLNTATSASALLYSAQLPGNPSVPLYTILKGLHASLQCNGVSTVQTIAVTLTDNEGLGYTFGTWDVQTNVNQGIVYYPDIIAMQGSELSVRGAFKLTLTATGGVDALLTWNFSGLSTNYPNFIWGPNG